MILLSHRVNRIAFRVRLKSVLLLSTSLPTIATAQDCRIVERSRVLLRSENRTAYTMTPNVTSVSGKMLLLSSSTFLTDSSGHLVPSGPPVNHVLPTGRAGLLVTPGTDEVQLVPMPDGVRAMQSPRALVVRDTAFVVWMIPQDTAAGTVDEIWTGKLVGTKWSSVGRLLAVPGVYWISAAASEFTMTADGYLMVSLVRNPTGGFGMLYLHFVNGRWEPQSVARSHFFAYPQLYETAAGLHMAFAGAEKPGDVNALYHALLQPPLAWTKATGVGGGGRIGLTELQVVGRTLLWMEGPRSSDASQSDSLAVASPSDTGWSVRRFALPHNARRLQATSTGGRTIVSISAGENSDSLLAGVLTESGVRFSLLGLTPISKATLFGVEENLFVAVGTALPTLPLRPVTAVIGLSYRCAP